jgi:DNA-binding NarL/FixJ family response regulator
VGHLAAVRVLRNVAPQIIAEYHAALSDIGSPLVARSEVWAQCRRQAAAILQDCAIAVDRDVPQATGDDYTRLLGAHRDLQGIPVAESVRAADLLWQAAQPFLEEAARAEAAPQRDAAYRALEAAFRTATMHRLYVGALGHEQTPAVSAANSALTPGPDSFAVTASPSGSSADALTRRELEILGLAADALTNKEIAASLGITEVTVKRHLANAYAKLGARSRLDAVRRLRRGAHPRPGGTGRLPAGRAN